MMKTVYLFAGAFLFNLHLSAQDTIYVYGEDIEAKVLEITADKVKFKKTSEPDGPVYGVALSRVYMIAYKNGTREVFDVPEEEGKKDETPLTTIQAKPESEKEQVRYKSLPMKRPYMFTPWWH